jgi:NADH-quinone oxidoreductase subunit L
MSLELLTVLIIALPLAGFLVTAIAGRRLGPNAFWVPVGAVVLSWLAAMAVVAAVLSGNFEHGLHGDVTGVTVHLWEWIPAGDFSVDISFFVDSLTAVLLIVVTTIGMLVHVYSIGYMQHDPGRWRFFAYLNLFMVSMLLLVLADNWLVVFVAWEGVGLCSYLLIGFWHRKRSAAEASKKAFIVNRVGDVGFALGIMAIFVNTGTLNIRESIEILIGSNPDLAGHMTGIIPIWVIALLIFAGAVGKSAQFPLHVWLPDAMEGPTPVSALIHAATMVNAGVYLVARANPIFASAPEVMGVVAAIGIFTAILAASIAMTQTDIKRVLAYSTLSQLGYMFAALGVGAFTAAIFHLMTHGFFKGLLFLGSGSVIHAVHDEQDMRKMGGLRKKIPATYLTMLIGAIAISGIPPLAGFFSKDEILGESFKLGFQWVWAIGVVVAVMTAFYMFRLIGMTFWGESRVDKAVEPKVHESPRVMTAPLWLLAIPSVILGAILTWPGPPLGPLFGVEGEGLLHGWLHPIFEHGEELLGHHEATFELGGIDGILIAISVAVALAGMLAAWRLFGVEIGPLRGTGRPRLVAALTNRLHFLYRASANKWWFDDINHLLFVVVGGRIAAAMAWFDREIVDGIVNGIGAVTRRSGGGLARVQTGRVQNYALGIALGLIAMAGSYFVLLGR